MNNKKTSKFAIRRAKETKLGRFLCRLAGEESGQAMMEYVIVAVMIAAVVAVGAWLFGAQIMGMFGVAGDSAIGNHDTAVANQNVLRTNKPTQDEAARTAAKAFQQAEGEGGAEGAVNDGEK